MFRIALLSSLVPALAFAQAPQQPQPVQPPVTLGQEVDIQAGKGNDVRPSKPLRIGVVPSLGAGADKESDALAKYLTKQLGQAVKPELFENHDAEANAVVAGRIDFAWMPPLQAFNAELGGAMLVQKLVRKNAGTYRSVFFVREDSKVQKLQDLKNATVGWVEANSATGHLFPLAMLAHEKLVPSALFKDEKYLGSHDAVCKAVWAKQVDVGATLADEPAADGKLKIDGCVHSLGANASKLRVLSVSEPVPNDAIAVRKGLDPAVTDKLKRVLAALPNSPEGKKILKDVLKADGVAPVNPKDFDPVQHALEAAADVEGK